jgi:uncharacterized protein YjbI with pentapeptide repeats
MGSPSTGENWLGNLPKNAGQKRDVRTSEGDEPLANNEHLTLLRRGTKVWNEWRERNPDVVPDLGGADLSSADLSEADLSEADLSGANLSEANLSQAHLRMVNLSEAYLGAANLFRAELWGANLRGADLSEADLNVANLSGSDLTGANLREAQLRVANLHDADLFATDLGRADLAGADLREADLGAADLSEANLGAADLRVVNLSQANLREANLREANLSEATLSYANLAMARLEDTVFGNVDLTETRGLDGCWHAGPSIIDFRTLYRSSNLPIDFLRGCGLPDNLIEYLPSLRRGVALFYSCFISYSGRDKVFTDRLHADLQNKGVRCWFAPHDLPIGAKTWNAIDEAIRLRDKLLLILSQGSIASGWVEDEVNKAYAEERSRKQVVLFPIRIDNEVMSTAEPWAVKLRDQRNIGDFRQWKKPTECQKSLDRLLRDLKASEAK